MSYVMLELARTVIMRGNTRTWYRYAFPAKIENRRAKFFSLLRRHNLQENNINKLVIINVQVEDYVRTKNS